ncbi:C12orf49 isoform 1 [Pan troglodytes]|uniref:SREBF pathway regulator in golgi 1 n=3 Tax=Hominidae TaxID=9604 RepID=F8VPB4_HUMAN|nr:C12orf49 isoform 1 [Pan troglodytes]PNJ82519.1 C12orf49 isoform 1 [Pongo abelii]
MVNLAAMVWRRLLRKRWVLALVFGLSLVYFLSSTFKQATFARGRICW